MVRTKYTFEKRQREIARHKKQEEKAARRAEAKKEKVGTDQESLDEPAVSSDPSETSPTPQDQ